MKHEMLSKNSYFIHKFDEIMHYLMHYSLLEIKNSDKIHINDSVQHKKCTNRLGRWNFTIANTDYSCGIYHALEIVRQITFSAIEKNKDSIDITLVSTESNPDVCYLFNHKVLPGLKNNESCKCDTGISKQIFFKIIKPTLEEMFKEKKLSINSKSI